MQRPELIKFDSVRDNTERGQRRLTLSRVLLYATGITLPFVFGGDGVLVVPFAVFPMAALGVTAAANLAMSGRGTRPKHVLFAVAVFVLPTLGVLTSGVHNEAVKRWLFHVLGLMTFLSMAAHMRAGRVRWRDALVSSNLFAFSLGMYFVVTSELAIREHGFAEVVAQRFVGGLMSLPWGTTNLVAGVLLFPTLIAVALVTSDDMLVRWTAVAGAAAGVVAIAMTLSRTSIVVMVAGATVLMLVRVRRRSHRAVVIALTAAMIVGVAQTGDGGPLAAAFSERWDRRLDTLNDRTAIWSDYGEQISRSNAVQLMLGHGLYMSYVNNQFSAHNLVLSLSYDIGLLGLAVAVVLGVRLLLIIRRGPLAFPLMIGSGAVLTCSMFEDILYAQQSILYGWLMAAAIAGVAVSTRAGRWAGRGS